MNSFNYHDKTVFYNSLNNMLPLIKYNGKILLTVENNEYMIISKNYVMDKYLIYINTNKKQKQIYLSSNQEIIKAIHTELAHKTVDKLDVLKC